MTRINIRRHTTIHIMRTREETHYEGHTYEHKWDATHNNKKKHNEHTNTHTHNNQNTHNEPHYIDTNDTATHTHN